MDEKSDNFEELYFAKTKFNINSMYFIFHSTLDGKLLHPIVSQYFSNLSYDNFCWYLRGASFEKNHEKLHLFNGIPSNICNSFFPDKILYRLKETELKKLKLRKKSVCFN